jgi:hypothetical protein
MLAERAATPRLTGVQEAVRRTALGLAQPSAPASARRLFRPAEAGKRGVVARSSIVLERVGGGWKGPWTIFVLLSRPRVEVGPAGERTKCK